MHKQFAFGSAQVENVSNAAAPLFVKYGGELPPWLAQYKEEIMFTFAVGALGFSSHFMSKHRLHPLTATLIKQCREKSGLEQAEFIKHHDIPVSQDTFTRWEAGKIAVPVGILLLLNLMTPVIPVGAIDAPNQQQ